MDVYEWSKAINDQQLNGTVERNGNLYTINVSWNVASLTPTVVAAQANAPSVGQFVMHLLPLQFRQRGLSLIELMVAILLSSLLFAWRAGAVQQY